jgi:uncharacterized protein HemX
MINKLHQSQTGIAHLGAILLLVIVLAGVGGAGYTVYQKQQGEEVVLVDATDNEEGDNIPADQTPDTDKDAVDLQGEE